MRRRWLRHCPRLAGVGDIGLIAALARRLGDAGVPAHIVKIGYSRPHLCGSAATPMPQGKAKGRRAQSRQEKTFGLLHPCLYFLSSFSSCCHARRKPAALSWRLPCGKVLAAPQEKIFPLGIAAVKVCFAACKRSSYDCRFRSCAGELPPRASLPRGIHCAPIPPNPSVSRTTGFLTI
jgi:hypothetical protein